MLGGVRSSSKEGASNRLRVLLDTSALLLIYDGIDIFNAIEDLLERKPEFMTLDSVINELNKLSSKSGSKRGLAARFILNKGLLNKVDVIESGQPNLLPDEAIINYVKKDPEVIVVTLDKELRKKLKAVGVKTLTWWLGRRKFAGG